jgi:hypothetical protein
MIYPGESSSASQEEGAPEGDPSCVGKMEWWRIWQGWDVETGRPKPGGMEETLEGGRGPPRAVAPLEREI